MTFRGDLHLSIFKCQGDKLFLPTENFEGLWWRRTCLVVASLLHMGCSSGEWGFNFVD